MRTTLKRGIGRSRPRPNGNGRAVLPPAIVSPIRRYAAARRSAARAGRWPGRFVLGLLALVLLARPRQRPAARTSTATRASSQVAAHSKDVKLAAEAPRPAAAEPAGDRARRRLRPARTATPTAAASDTMMLLRADPRRTTTRSRCSRSRATSYVPLWCGTSTVCHDRINGAYALCGSKGDARHREAPDGPPDQLPDHRQLQRLHPDRRPASAASGSTSTGATTTRTSAPRRRTSRTSTCGRATSC